MVERHFQAEQAYLHIPIANITGDYRKDPGFHYVRVLQRDGLLTEFYMKIAREKRDYYAPLYLGDQLRQGITLRCDDADAPEDLFDGILIGGAIEQETALYPDLYHERYRNQFHFSARRGWLNDPNGLVYVDGVYHMYFQHNPFGITHGGVNVSWGHAVSRDLVHWQELHDAIYPVDACCEVASGTAIRDRENRMGHGAGAIVSAHTQLKSPAFRGRPENQTRGQFVLYSTDGGMTYQRTGKVAAVPVPAGEDWRDPKLLQLSDGRLCMAVYETVGDRTCVSFYSSDDFLTWKWESRTMDLYECPDLFPLRVQETGEVLWVLYGADGRYRIGDFVDYNFRPNGSEGFIDYGENVYAGQTWNDTPGTDERLHIAWINHGWDQDLGSYSGKVFSQCMSVACTLRLHQTEEGYSLFRSPVAELTSLRKSGQPLTGGEVRVPLGTALEVVVEADPSQPLAIQFGEHQIDFRPETATFTFSEKTYRLFDPTRLSLRLFADQSVVEIFINDEMGASYAFLTDGQELMLQGNYVRGSLYPLQSIWQEER